MNGEDDKLNEQPKKIRKIRRSIIHFSQLKNKSYKIRQVYNFICLLARSAEDAAHLINELHKKVNLGRSH
jgi:hypothetical protein